MHCKFCYLYYITVQPKEVVLIVIIASILQIRKLRHRLVNDMTKGMHLGSDGTSIQT